MSAALSNYRSLSRQPPPDPDIHATLSDFLTYTEHFPAHLTRALALIEEQRARAEEKIQSIHDDTTTWSTLPSIGTDRPDPVKIRRDISYALEEAETACRMAVEEANRLDETCQREAKRLDTVAERLKAQPIPPSRDPTPEQQALTSPNLKRERRMSMRADDDKVEKKSRKLLDKAATKLRGRKIMVPGEVLPPPDPNAPVESISDWTSPRASPIIEELEPEPEPTLALKEKTSTPRPRSRTPKVPKQADKEKKNIKPRGPRLAGQPGTNAHSAVAGISTSNALLALNAPPEEAPNGSKWLPWMKLTEWEMARLRKRMKKNAIWVPSGTMVRRELKNLGRGVSGKEAARARAESGGEPFVDESSDKDPTRVIINGNDTAHVAALLENEHFVIEDAGDDADQELINRGMRLNEAKKLKRQRMLEEQALQAQIAREQGLEMPATADSRVLLPAPDIKEGKKRKRQSTPTSAALAGSLQDTPDPLSKPGPAPKRLKITAPSTSTSKIVPLAPAGASPKSSSARVRDRRAATPPTANRKVSLILKAAKAVSEEPPNRRASLRRSSNASLPNGTLTSPVRGTTAKSGGETSGAGGGGRRSRRPAPGILTTTAGDGESAKVGVSKRKAAPRKRGTPAATPSSASGSKSSTAIPEALVPEEFDVPIDPDEPRYCLCGDVSWGTMIACDNEDNCEKEWFHLSCVGLDGMPPRRTKWYCPDCRRKLRVGIGSNGLVGRQVGR